MNRKRISLGEFYSETLKLQFVLGLFSLIGFSSHLFKSHGYINQDNLGLNEKVDCYNIINIVNMCYKT